MGTYLKKFETQAAYEAAQSGLILPNVSLTVDNNTVHYNPSTPVPPTPSHDYIEIGGFKWATMNVGANSVTDTGLYFQYGDTQGYTAAQVGTDKQFNWNDYKYITNAGTSNSAFTKYNSTDGKTVLDTSDDAVVANWGGNWRMPTAQEIQSLITATTSAWTTNYENSGVAGLVLTSTADNSKKLFFPAAGFCYNDSVYNVGKYGNYWSSSLDTSDVQNAYFLNFDSSEVYWNGNYYRYYGRPVRGVVGE